MKMLVIKAKQFEIGRFLVEGQREHSRLQFNHRLTIHIDKHYYLFEWAKIFHSISKVFLGCFIINFVHQDAEKYFPWCTYK